MTSVSDIQILIVDDNRQMRYLVRCLLRAAGIFRVAEAETALEAFDLMHQFPVDLLMVDWRMSPVDGIEFTRMVRRSESSPNPCVPILMMTAHTELSRVAAARDAGVSGFLKKPISSRTMLEKIGQSLLDERVFVRTETYYGPDRRRGAKAGYDGPMRRFDDTNPFKKPDSEAYSVVDIDDLIRRARN
jgi:CheY-like chemotaxis protein